ncbi:MULTISPECIES: hypothetical protein [Synechococcales]|nr:hypothetical protein [Synechococcus sp. CS-1333]
MKLDPRLLLILLMLAAVLLSGMVPGLPLGAAALWQAFAAFTLR